jgi:hypothetical protein
MVSGVQGDDHIDVQFASAAASRLNRLSRSASGARPMAIAIRQHRKASETIFEQCGGNEKLLIL